MNMNINIEKVWQSSTDTEVVISGVYEVKALCSSS